MRLDKFLSDMGVGTRSELKKEIRRGAVTVDGSVVRDPGTAVTEESKICVNGEPVAYETFVYYMLHKPAGVVTATEDKKQKTVLDLIDDRTRKDLFPVGRLDRDTEGLLLITNDGQMAHRLLSPKHHVDKVYFARVSGECTEEDVRKFAAGLQVDEELHALPAELKILRVVQPGNAMNSRVAEGVGTTEKTEITEAVEIPENSSDGTASFPEEQPGVISEVEVTIREGKFHQIKRMFQAVGKDVVYLKRLSMGPLVLDEKLASGAYRRLTEKEKETLLSKKE